MKNTLILLGLISLFLASCENKNSTREINDKLAQPIADTLAQGVFVDKDAHKLSGNVLVYKDVAGNVLVSMENFSVLDGPDVEVYLSDSANYRNVVKIGKFFNEDGRPIKGQIIYDIDDKTDFKKYNHVIVWCKQYSVLFGYAELK